MSTTTDPVAHGRLAEAFAAFLAEYPEFDTTRAIDELRTREFSRLDEQQHVYLDYTGGGLYAARLIREHQRWLLSGIYGNPHSINPSSLATSERVESARRRVLAFFNGSPEEYVVIFTANASQALKLVGESYPFRSGEQFLLTFDNHNSVNGIREFDRARGARTTYLPVLPPTMRADEEALDRLLATADPGVDNLFAYPAQSNFSGAQHPLAWIGRAQACGWDVLLDAAAFVPTNRLDLTAVKPDFVALSFYKMFGYPTGVGALLGRRRALAKLHRPWFAGGTITVASVQADRHCLAPGAAAFEDGTPDYLAIPAVEYGLDLLEEVGLATIHRRVACLAGWLQRRLVAIAHPNGRPLAQVYGPPPGPDRGGTVTFNFFDRDGRLIDHQRIEAQAARRNISLRTGCFCNPGAGEMALGLGREELTDCFTRSGSTMTYEQFRDCIDGKGTGAVRVSVGLASNFADVEAFLALAEEIAR